MNSVRLCEPYIPKPVPILLSTEGHARRGTSLPPPLKILADFFGDDPARGPITVPLLGKILDNLPPRLSAGQLTRATAPQALQAMMALLANGYREVFTGEPPEETEGSFLRSLKGTNGLWSVSVTPPHPTRHCPYLTFSFDALSSFDVRLPVEIEFEGASGRFIGWGTNWGFPINTIHLKMGWRFGRSMSVAHSIQIGLESPPRLYSETYWFNFGPSENWGADPLREFLDMGHNVPIQHVALRLGAAILASGQYESVRSPQDFRLAGAGPHRRVVETGPGRFDYPPNFPHDRYHRIHSVAGSLCEIEVPSATSDTLILSLVAPDIGERPSFVLAPIFRELWNFMKGLIAEASLKASAA